MRVYKIVGIAEATIGYLLGKAPSLVLNWGAEKGSSEFHVARLRKARRDRKGTSRNARYCRRLSTCLRDSLSVQSRYPKSLMRTMPWWSINIETGTPKTR